MSSFVPTTPDRPLNHPSPEGHASPTKRVHPRTSLHSPYSERLARSSPKRQHGDPSSSSPGFEDADSSSSVQDISSCSPQRHPLPRYQKRQLSHPGEDPAVSAIRTTYAEETKEFIPVLTGRLEQLSLEENGVWEDLVMYDASQRNEGSFSCPSTSGALHTPVNAVASLPFTYDSSPTFNSPDCSVLAYYSSGESSPGVLTPPQPSCLLSSCSLSVASPGAHPSLQLPSTYFPSSPPPAEVCRPVVDMEQQPVKDISDDVSAAEIEASIEREPQKSIHGASPRITKPSRGKTKRDGRIKTSHRDRSADKLKVKSVSAKELAARRVAFASKNSIRGGLPLRKPMPGTRTHPRTRESAPDHRVGLVRDARCPSTSVASVPERGRERAGEGLVRNGAESAERSKGNLKLKRRHAIKPYSKDQRSRAKRSSEDAVTLPGYLGWSLDTSDLGQPGAQIGRKQSTQHRVPLLQTPPKRTAVAFETKEPRRVNGDHQATDAALARPSVASGSHSLQNESPTPRLMKNKQEEEEAAEVERFLLALQVGCRTLGVASAS